MTSDSITFMGERKVWKVFVSAARLKNGSIWTALKPMLEAYSLMAFDSYHKKEEVGTGKEHFTNSEVELEDSNRKKREG